METFYRVQIQEPEVSLPTPTPLPIYHRHGLGHLPANMVDFQNPAVVEKDFRENISWPSLRAWTVR
jgi:hypothetical protein